MALNDCFKVAAEIFIQRNRRVAMFENLERFREQTGTRRLGRQQSGDDTLIRFDEDLIAFGREGQDSIEVACRLRARDVNNRHNPIVARIRIPRSNPGNIIAPGKS